MFSPNYLVRQLRARLGKPRQVEQLSLAETLRRVIEDGVALSRFGDGELKLVLYVGALRFQRHSWALETALNRVLFTPNDRVLRCFNGVFAASPQWEWVARYERYPKTPDGFRTVHEPNDIMVLERARRQSEFVRHWRIVRHETELETYGSAEVFFLGLYVDAYAAGTMEAVLDKFRALFSGRRILFVCPERPMGGLSFPEQAETMQRLGLKSAQFIRVPEIDAFEHTARIREEILATKGFDDLFIQAGPAATVWAYDLAERIDGRVLDVGSLSAQLRYLV